MKVLVTYASKYGSTAEIAEVIGKELIKREYEVEVKPISEVGSLAEYDGFVIGSAVYAGSCPKISKSSARKWIFSNAPRWINCARTPTSNSTSRTASPACWNTSPFTAISWGWTSNATSPKRKP